MAESQLPCPTVLRQLLRYEPETGKLFWRPRAPAWFKNNAAHDVWTQKYCGKEALIGRNAKGYRKGSVLYKQCLAHRAIYAMMTGRWPADQIDHINGVPDDNRWMNIRSVTPAENSKNLARPKNNTSGYVGVWMGRTKKWQADIIVNNKKIHLGSFDQIEDAAAARAAAEVIYGFHPNHGRGI